MTHYEYWAEIASICALITDEEGDDQDVHDRLHESIDGHEFIIYTSCARSVMMHTDHEDECYEQMGEWPQVDSWGQMVTVCAYHAMLADVQAHSDWGAA